MKKLLAFLIVLVLCITCFAACGEKKETAKTDVDTGSKPTQVVYDVDEAAAYLKTMYKKYLKETETAADFTLVSQVMKGGVVYTVEWTVDNEEVKIIVDEANKEVKIDVNEKTQVATNYKLTATIKDPNGKTATLSFDLTVPKYVLATWQDYMDAEAGKAVIVEGYVVAVHSQSEGNKYNQLYLQDVNGDGGYYIYSIANSVDPVKDLGIKMGMLVSVTGTKDIYSGTHEVKDAVVNIIDSSITDIKPYDLTKEYKNATSLKDDALISKLGMLVTIKGVEIADQDLAEKSMYMNFKLAGLTSYIRVYATDCPVSVSDAGQQKIIDDHAKKTGYSADVTGVVVQYSGAIYLNPVSDTPFKYIGIIQRTDEEKVQVEMDEVKFDKDVPLNKVIELPLVGKTYNNVNISWVSNSPDYIVIDGNKAKITLGDKATTASITGTFKLGNITKTKTITFNLAKKSAVVAQNAANPTTGTAYKFFMTQLNVGKVLYFNGELANNYYGATTEDPNEAVDVYLEAATGGYYLTFTKGGVKQYLTVVSAEVDGSVKYNVAISKDKPAYVCTLDAALENAPIVTIGDQKLFIGSYNSFETMSASKYSYASTNFVAHLGNIVDTSKVSDADKVATEKNAVTVEDEIFANAEITLPTKGSIYSEVAISWASDNACAVVNGNKLTITLGDEAQTVKLTATLKLGTVTVTKEFTIAVAAAGFNLTSIPTMNELGAAQATSSYTSENYYVAGVISEIANTQYGNLYIVDENGNKLYVYGLYDATGALRFDAMANQPKVGDYVVIMGPAGNYKGDPQTKNAKLMEHIAATSLEDANTIAGALENKTSTTEKYLVTGTITEIKNTQYGNVYIEDANGNKFYVYGLKDSTGATRYDALTTKPAVGDTITIYGILKNYNGAQMENGWIYGYVAGTPAGGDEGDDEGGNEGGNTGSTTTMPYTVGKEYLMSMVQETAGKTLYLSGSMDGFYFGSVEDPAAAVKVVLEKDGDGYQIYFMDGSTKTYLTIIPSGTYNNTTFVTSKPSDAWKWNSSLSTLTLTVSSGEFFLGTRNDKSYVTFSACAVSYVDNFKAVLVEPTAGGNQGGNTGGNEGGNTGSGSVVSGALAATFTLGTNDSSKTDESQQVQDGTEVTTEYTEENNGYTLTLTGLSKFYKNAYDAKGNACIKLGTSSKVGTFTFTVPENVKSVKIYVAGYKAKVGNYTINGGSKQSTTKTSGNGEYDVITIDTSSTKTITFATVSSGYRVKINTIEFYN